MVSILFRTILMMKMHSKTVEPVKQENQPNPMVWLMQQWPLQAFGGLSCDALCSRSVRHPSMH